MVGVPLKKFSHTFLYLASILAGCGGKVDEQSMSATAHIDLETDEANCGSIGYACLHGRECISAKCFPAWQEISSTDAPTPRVTASAATMGGKYVIFGGCTALEVQGAERTGAAYDPSTDTWAPIADMVHGRHAATAAATDTGISVFGGLETCWDASSSLNVLENISSTAGAWSAPLIALGSPTARYNSSMIWTGEALFLYGGSDPNIPANSTGALYIPSGCSSWTDAACTVSGGQRGGAYSMFMDGTNVRVWGGGPFGNAPDGLTYDVAMNVWSSWTVPDGTPDLSSISVGMPRFADDGRRLHFLASDSTVWTFDRTSNAWTNDTEAPPSGFCAEAPPSWVGGELIAYSGYCGDTMSSVGARYQPPAPVASE